jgi:pimeloyl-ACP methyl ester carboxylesterase
MSIVLLPGLLCDAALWRHQVEALSAFGPVLVPDLTRDDSVAAMAQRVLAAAPGRFALVGLSMGGYVAFEVLRQAMARVTRLALLDTSAAPDTAERGRERAQAIASLGLGHFQGVTVRMLPRLVHADHVAGPVGAEVRAMAERVGGEAFLRQQRAIAGRPDSRDLLGAITVPTMVAVGDSDALTPPAEAVAIHAQIRGSTLHRFARCGHLPPLESPDETVACLRGWLAA